MPCPLPTTKWNPSPARPAWKWRRSRLAMSPAGVPDSWITMARHRGPSSGAVRGRMPGSRAACAGDAAPSSACARAGHALCPPPTACPGPGRESTPTAARLAIANAQTATAARGGRRRRRGAEGVLVAGVVFTSMQRRGAPPPDAFIGAPEASAADAESVRCRSWASGAHAAPVADARTRRAPRQAPHPTASNRTSRTAYEGRSRGRAVSRKHPGPAQRPPRWRRCMRPVPRASAGIRVAEPGIEAGPP